MVIAVIEQDSVVAQTAALHTATIALFVLRGNILRRTMEVLATSSDVRASTPSETLLLRNLTTLHLGVQYGWVHTAINLNLTPQRFSPGMHFGFAMRFEMALS